MTAKEMLEKAGFDMKPAGVTFDDWGKIAPEPYDVGKDHFTPEFRDVYIGGTFDNRFYVTSHIYGEYRKYRCRRKNSGFSIGNIFGKGKTKEEAVKNFLKNFTAVPKIYNRSK